MNRCTLPSRSQIITGTGPRTCGEIADVRTEVPMTTRNGENVIRPMLTCLAHACEVAVCKLLAVIAHETRQREIERRRSGGLIRL